MDIAAAATATDDGWICVCVHTMRCGYIPLVLRLIGWESVVSVGLSGRVIQVNWPWYVSPAGKSMRLFRVLRSTHMTVT